MEVGHKEKTPMLFMYGKDDKTGETNALAHLRGHPAVAGAKYEWRGDGYAA